MQTREAPVIRAALLGAGRRAQTHLSALDRLADEGKLRLMAVADINREAAAAAAEPRGATTYRDAADLLDHEDIDVVYLIVPYNLHPQLAPMVLERRKHLFLEKPLAIEVQDAVDLGRAAVLAARDGVLTSVGYQRRYGMDFEHCLDLFRETPPMLIAGHWYWGMPPTQWARQFANNGGQVFAQLTHQLDLARALLGEVRQVHAICDRLARVTPEDAAAGFDNWDVYALTLRFASGAVGTFHSTYALFRDAPNGQDLRIIGRELLVQLVGGQLEVTRCGEHGTAAPTEIIATAGDTVLAMHRTFTTAIQRQERDLIRTPIEDAVVTSAVCAAANLSAQTGEIIDVDSLLSSHGWDASPGGSHLQAAQEHAP